MGKTVRKRGTGVGADILWIVLFLIVFINGFEAGGYQASLWSIGQHYNLSDASKGLFASVELFATMLAPILLGRWADRTGKGKSILILLCLQLLSATIIFVSSLQPIFLAGIFFLGLTTSALQFISIAALADAYPVSGKRKIGYMTSMYALGALVSPLIVSLYLRLGLGWRTLFVFLALGSAAALIGVRRSGDAAREARPGGTEETTGSGHFMLSGILLLCVVMCVYVGFENGFAFFVDTLFTDVLKASGGKYALSLFWAVMIPSRVLTGRFSRYARRILLAATLAIPCVTVAAASLSDSRLVMLLCVPLGLASGAIYPCSLTMLLPFAGKRTATATGMITTATGIGGVAFTAFTGFAAELWGIRVAMASLGGFVLLSALAVLGAENLYRKAGFDLNQSSDADET